jgi:hypothetical protein
MNRIFLLGSERSGSNLLRTLLGNHSKINAPVAPHFCDVFVAHFPLYKRHANGKEKLLEDLQRYANHTFNAWDLQLDIPRMLKEYELNSFVQFVNAMYSEKAKSEGKTGYFSKDNHNHKYALGILKDFPDAKFIFLYRDPRDQVASWLRSPIHLHTPYKAIVKWDNEQRACLQLRDFYQVDMHLVKYEDLVDDTEKVMTGVLKYLGFEIEPNCFNTKKDNKEATKIPHWQNLNKPVMKNNYGKFRDVLSQRDVEMIETISMREMRELGYPSVTQANWKRGHPYVFRVSQKIKEVTSRRKNRDFIKNEMGILLDKQKFVKSLFSDLRK